MIKFVATSILVFVITLQILDKTFPKIVECSIVDSNSQYRTISCNDTDESTIKFDLNDWPKAWNDATKVGQLVKIEITEDGYFALESCEARTKLAMDKAIKNRVREGSLPLNFYIPKDCQ